jgi:hypothetical protein
MAPNITSAPTGVLFEDDSADTLSPSVSRTDTVEKQRIVTNATREYKLQIVWRNVILFAYLHLAALYGAYLLVTSAKWPTVIWGKCFVP